MSQKFFSDVTLSTVTGGSMLKVDANGKIVPAVDGTDYISTSASSQWTNTLNGIYYSDDVRIGTYQASVSPAAKLHVFDYQTTIPKFLIEDGNTGDASMEFKISTQSYVMGIDNSDSDKFVIAASTALGTTNVLEISTAGLSAFQKSVLFNDNVYLPSAVATTTNTSALFVGAAGIVEKRTLGSAAFSATTDFLGATAKAADSDKLDGIDSGSFLRSDATDTASGAITFTSNVLQLSGHYYHGFYSGTTNYIHLYSNGHTGSASVTYMRAWTGSTFRALKIDGSSNDITWGSHKLWTSGNDGSGSGLDADTLDGSHASDFAAASHTQAWSTITSTPTTLSGYGITDAASSNHTHSTLSGTANDIIALNSTLQVDQGSTDAVIQFNYGGVEKGKFDQDGYLYATGFKVSGSTGFLKADGSVDTGTYLTTATGDVRYYQQTEIEQILDGTTGIDGYNKTNWDTAYGWGDHDGLYAAASHNQAWSTITSTPTTLAGYGITDAASSSHDHDTDYLGIAGKAADSDLLDGLNSSQFLRSDTAGTLAYNTDSGEALRFANSTSGGLIQIGMQQNDADGMHHRAYLRAYKSSAGSVAGKFDIVIRSVGGGTTTDIFELEAGAKAKWQGSALATELWVSDWVGQQEYLTSIPSDISVTSATIGGVKLEASPDRPGTLEINRDGTNSWAGIITKYSDTAEWALMGNESTFGLYDDQSNQWAWVSTENGGTVIRYQGVDKINTTATGVNVSGDIAVSGTVDGVDIAAFKTAYDSHTHSTYAPLASPALTGTPTAPTAAAGTNTTQIATTAFVSTAVSALVDSAPATLDTLNELAAALGDDANFSTTVTNSLATKLPLSGGTMTGDLQWDTSAAPTNTHAKITFGQSPSPDGSLDGMAQVADYGADGYGLLLHVGYGESDNGGIKITDDGVIVWGASDENVFTVIDEDSRTERFRIDNSGNITASGTITASGYNNSNWDTAYGWGNHASAGYLTASYLDDYTRGSYRVISDYGGNSTWYIRSNGQFVWGTGHDWTASFRLNIDNGSGYASNGSWAYFGQQNSNAGSGTWRGVRITKYEGGAVDGDLSAGAFYIGDNRKDDKWDAAYSWGNHASANYADGQTLSTLISDLGSAAYVDTTAFASASHNHNSTYVAIAGGYSDGDFTWDGTHTFGSTIEAVGIAIGNTVTLTESTDRADLLSINSGTSGWGGLQITNTSGEGIWSFMVDGSAAGIYDDQNGDWAIYCVENSYVELRHNSSGKLATTSSGVAVTGNIDVSGNILTANANGLVSDANARILTGTGGGTWQAYAGASNNSAFLINNSAGTTQWNFDLGGTGVTQVSNNVVPNGGGVYNLGDDVNRWRFVYCNILDSAGLHEQNLQDEEQPIGQYETGTVLTWRDGKNRPCNRYADHMRMGIAVKGQDSPLVQGAEPVLCTGKVEEGDYLVTSRKEGHAEAVSRHIVMQQMLWDCVIGKALENSEGESHLVKTWVNI